MYGRRQIGSASPSATRGQAVGSRELRTAAARGDQEIVTSGLLDGTAALSATILDATRRLAAAVARDSRIHAHANCVVGDETCASQYADIVFLALDEAAVGESVVAFWRDLHAAEVPGAQQTIAALHAQSADALERIVALRFLQDFDHLALDARSYTGLSERPVVEAIAIAQRHAVVPPPSSAVDELRRTAASSDTRLRRTSIRALGHEGTAPQLLAVLQGAPLVKSDYHHIAHAIRSCGAACLPSLQHLLGSGDQGLRVALYENLALLEGADRAVLADALRSVPISAEEERIRSEWLGK